ncbi:MAG TPA: acetylornithine transaminase [Caldilineae bacterium]|nr:acetylornithine transaminase [Caldilineae bacterium]
MTEQEIIALEQKYILQTYTRPPFVIQRGEGCTLYDSQGRAYLDLVSGIAVNALGYGDPELVRAIQQQAARLIHVSNLYHMEPHVRLAQMLCEHSFADRVFFCNSGAEANEGAIKFARKWAKTRFPDQADRKVEIVAFEGGFHGRTIGTLALTPREKYQAPFRPLMPGVRIARFNDLDSAAEAITDDTCAVIVEPIQGEGGIRPAEKEFLRGLRELCDQHQALLIFDEVQCGLGRTGTLWAHEFYGVTPDIMTLAKPLGGGLPIGAVLVTEEVGSVMQPGDHGSTFGANPVACAAAQVVVRRISEPLFLADVRTKGEYLMEQLQEINSPHIKEIRGRGLMVGIEMDIPVTPIIQAGYERGLIMVNAGENVLRLVPPLVIKRADLERAVTEISEILKTL